MLVLTCALVAGGCSNAAGKKAEADAKAAHFVPPSAISRADYGTLQDHRFHTLDRDGDDVLTRAELPRANSRLRALDRNKDGEITSSEFSEGQIARFDRMDRNKDGTLTADEREGARGK